ncbi:MAG: aminotransferase class V-fold PLP-dependent enzyme [Anaerolineae bacterium]
MTNALLHRSDYPALERTIYLNQASLGMLGQPAVTAMQSFVENVGRHGNLFMSDADEVSYYENLRHQGSLILGSPPRQIAILSGASELFGQLPYLLPVLPDQNVLLLSSDFPAITRPWLRLQQVGGCNVQFVDNNPDQDLTETLCAAINEQTAVVAISYVQYATGCKIDPHRLRQATAAVGAKLVIDVTQAAGAVPILADDWSADVVISSGYKWLGGHGGVALAALAPDLLKLAPPLPGWMGATDPFDFDATELDLAPDARRFTQSTMSYASLAALTVGIEQLLKVGIEKIEAHANALAEQLVAGLTGSGWEPFRSLADRSASAHIISLAHPSQDVDEAVQRLRAANIVCGARGGRIRVSLAAYNNSADVEQFVATLLMMK